MKKILFIDSWRKGYRNFTRLNDEFVRNGYETILVHTGSFIENENIKEEIIEGLLVRDISFYNTVFIKKVIEIENPDVILMLNLSFIFDRALINISKFKNIKIVYLAHGKLIEKEEVEINEKNLNKNIWTKLSRIFRKKNFLVLINYISSQIGFRKIYIPIKTFISLLLNPSNFLVSPRYNNELDADLIMLYTEGDRQLLVEKFNFPPQKIVVVGNPEIPVFINKKLIPRDKFLNSLSLKPEHEYVLYLDDGLVVGKIWTVSEFYNHLNDIVQIMGNQKLVIKLHPRENLTNHLSFFNEKGIIALVDIDFKNLIYNAKSIISHYSSTIIYGLIFNKVVYIPKWGKSLDLTNNYPGDIVNYCYSTQELKEKLCDNNVIEKVAVETFFKANGINIEINSIKLVVSEISKLFK